MYDILRARFDAQGDLLGQATAGGAGTDRANGVATVVDGTSYGGTLAYLETSPITNATGGDQWLQRPVTSFMRTRTR